MASKKGSSSKGKETLNLDDLATLGPEDRIAVMRMVKDGELGVDEAIRKVKGEVEILKGGRFGRRGAVKKGYRGRMNLDIQVIKASAFSILKLDIFDCRDLIAMNNGKDSDPYVKCFLKNNGTDLAAERASKKKTSIHKHTRNPIFNETFQWEVRSNSDLNNLRLHIAVWDKEGGFSRNQFMGSMSFFISRAVGRGPRWRIPS